jgi:hypothetical protein
MVEDSLGMGRISRTRQEVRSFITRDNMDKYEAELDKDNNAFSFSFESV